MKNIFTLLIGIVFSITSLNAQDNAPPQALSYQAVINRENGLPVAMQKVQLRISIYQNNFENENYLKYRETIDAKTNILGQVNIEIGKGTDTTGTFSEIPWSEDIFYLKVEALYHGSKGFQQVSCAQSLSVPYALYAGNTGPKGTKTGDLLYWHGKDWEIIPPGADGQVLTVVDSVPTWSTPVVPCIPDLISPQTDEILDNGCYQLYGNDPKTWSFKWEDCPGATKYELYVADACYLAIDTVISNTEYTSSDSSYTFYIQGWTWNVRAFANGKWGPWSDERTFTVEPVNTDCPVTPELARDITFNEMKEWYLWYNMPEATSVTEDNKDNYKDPYELLEAMRYKKLDKMSFVTDYDSGMLIDNGEYIGHGIGIGLDQDGSARITYIYNQSSLYPYGVRRGWIIKKINNVDVTPDLFKNGSQGLSDLLGPPTEGITTTFLFIQPSGDEVTISSTKSTLTMNAVLLAEVLQLKSGPTAHLVLDTFFGTCAEELQTAFAFFKASGVKDLILDMRYNGGGWDDAADNLASYIVGNSKAGSTFSTMIWNDKHQDANYSEPLLTTDSPLDLSRVVIITTRATTSVSEMVINGLKPYINVVTIGDTTYGEPIDGGSWYLGQKYVVTIAELKLVNSQNEGDYWDGIAPTIAESDDITHDFNDSNESCLNKAINYLENGSAPTAKGLQVFKSYPTFSEKPKWVSRMSVNKKRQNNKSFNTNDNQTKKQK